MCIPLFECAEDADQKAIKLKFSPYFGSNAFVRAAKPANVEIFAEHFGKKTTTAQKPEAPKP